MFRVNSGFEVMMRRLRSVLVAVVCNETDTFGPKLQLITDGHATVHVTSLFQHKTLYSYLAFPHPASDLFGTSSLHSRMKWGGWSAE